MSYQVDCYLQYRNSARDRKAAKRQMRGLREKRKRPRHNLQQDRTRAQTMGKWTITRYGELGFLFEEICEQVRSHLLSRKKIDQDRKRIAIRALGAIDDLEVERLCKQGAIIRWKNTGDETFEVHMRESDCLAIDHQQWRFERSVSENETISIVLRAYEGIHRTQVEQLLDEGKTLYDSDRLGLISITLKAGLFHNEYLKAQPNEFERSLLKLTEAA